MNFRSLQKCERLRIRTKGDFNIIVDDRVVVGQVWWALCRVQPPTIMAAPWPSTMSAIGLALLALCSLVKSSSYQGCTAVKNAYTTKGFNHLEVPNKMISGECYLKNVVYPPLFLSQQPWPLSLGSPTKMFLYGLFQPNYSTRNIQMKYTSFKFQWHLLVPRMMNRNYPTIFFSTQFVLRFVHHIVLAESINGRQSYVKLYFIP